MKSQLHTGEKRPLQDVMNMMARRPDGCAPIAVDKSRAAVSEAEAYARFDPLLAGLLKDSRDAQGHHEILNRRHGAADPMTSVASDMASSADAAVQTRLIELRACPDTRVLAEEFIEAHLESIAAGARHREKMNNFAHQVADETRRVREDRARDSFFWMMMLWMMLNDVVMETQRRLSLAQDFAVVSNHNRRAVA